MVVYPGWYRRGTLVYLPVLYTLVYFPVYSLHVHSWVYLRHTVCTSANDGCLSAGCDNALGSRRRNALGESLCAKRCPIVCDKGAKSVDKTALLLAEGINNDRIDEG